MTRPGTEPQNVELLCRRSHLVQAFREWSQASVAEGWKPIDPDDPATAEDQADELIRRIDAITNAE